MAKVTIETIERRKDEYIVWLHENLERDLAGLPPLPRLPWDKDNNHVTYRDVKNKTDRTL